METVSLWIKYRRDFRGENHVVQVLSPAMSWQSEVGAFTYAPESDFLQEPSTRQPRLGLHQILKSSELFLCPEAQANMN